MCLSPPWSMTWNNFVMMTQHFFGSA